jgi:hypothetical protein
MVLRNHWLQAGFDGTMSTSTFKNDVLTVPAGATLKKVLLLNASVSGRHTVVGWGTSPNISAILRVTINNSVYSNRVVYQSGRMLPHVGYALYDSFTTQRIYSQIWSAGDNELGVNQQMNYNGPGQPALTVTCFLQFLNQELGPADINLRVLYNWRVLYYL